MEAAWGIARDHKVTSISELASCYQIGTPLSNHVIDSSGRFIDDSGSSRGLSTLADRELLVELRRQSDLVIVDAATARQERYQQLSNCTLAIVSKSGDFSEIPAAGQSKVVCFTGTEVSLADLEANSIAGLNPIAEILQWAKQQGFQAPLIETGPTLTRIAAQSGALSRAALTVSQRLTQSELAEIKHPLWPTAKLLSACWAEGTTFTLWG